MIEKTGFSEINQERLGYTGDGFWYCEVAVTGACNFSCKYCNRLNSEIDFVETCDFIEKYAYSLKHVQITGGEPTLYAHIRELCARIKSRGLKVGLSTNGSADLSLYRVLDIDMFSISLDDYDYDVLVSRGYKHVDRVVSNIVKLSNLGYYVNVGLVVDSLNVSRVSKIIRYILDLGVNDIKLSVSTKDEVTPVFPESEDYSAYPILNYRVGRFRQGKSMRGLSNTDTFKCSLSRSDISIVGRDHYPCLVYAREGGRPIGPLSSDVKGARLNWVEGHSPKDDPICQRYCMDFKCAYNRAADHIKTQETV